jgi:hypothetical protein
MRGVFSLAVFFGCATITTCRSTNGETREGYMLTMIGFIFLGFLAVEFLGEIF